jgi:hypothetical protein
MDVIKEWVEVHLATKKKEISTMFRRKSFLQEQTAAAEACTASTELPHAERTQVIAAASIALDWELLH